MKFPCKEEKSHSIKFLNAILNGLDGRLYASKTVYCVEIQFSLGLGWVVGISLIDYSKILKFSLALDNNSYAVFSIKIYLFKISIEKLKIF